LGVYGILIIFNSLFSQFIVKTQNKKYSTILAQSGFSKEVPLSIQYKKLKGGQIKKYSLILLSGP